MKKTRLIIVGGFLGAGKTTLLFESARNLIENGQHIGLITNDQAPELVDTALLLHSSVKVSEVSGSCFCCNFDGFINSIKQIKSENQLDIIIAEPVGSCTDLSATIMQPLKEYMKTELIVSPLTVLADPVRLEDILNGGTAGLHSSAAYIFRKQLEESDIILITKSDLLKTEELNKLKEKIRLQYPEPQILAISSITGEGIKDWLKLVMESNKAGLRLIEVDYDIYAEGEAVLGWLNGTVSLQGKQINWDGFARNFLSELSQKIDTMGVSVGHIKIILETDQKYLTGNLTGKSDTLKFRGMAGVSNTAQLIINARVGLSPDILEKMIKETLKTVTGDSISLKTKAWQCLSPGYPNPTYRYNKVVQ